jgi:hypothetical protein
VRFDLTIVYNVFRYLFVSAELRLAANSEGSPSTGDSHGGNRERGKFHKQPSQAEFEAAVPYVRVFVALPLALCL